MGFFSKKKKDEPIIEEKPIETEKETPVTKKETITEPIKKTESKNKVWHITKRAEDGRWQVKAEGASKATKLFRTKAEAEEYVKTLVNNNEGSRVVPHKKDGKYQKK
ncbi:MAG: DUF2188 domain-containing protein [Candidatus Methanomethylophilaceae archaeon]|nr:DUF2188 domain-containing protein [Candidatus Methanomethylophilaceae archaeon]